MEQLTCLYQLVSSPLQIFARFRLLVMFLSDLCVSIETDKVSKDCGTEKCPAGTQGRSSLQMQVN